MRFSKTQQETYDMLIKLIERRGRGWVLGWALGLLINLSQHDPALRRIIRRKLDDLDS